MVKSLNSTKTESMEHSFERVRQSFPIVSSGVCRGYSRGFIGSESEYLPAIISTAVTHEKTVSQQLCRTLCLINSLMLNLFTFCVNASWVNCNPGNHLNPTGCSLSSSNRDIMTD